METPATKLDIEPLRPWFRATSNANRQHRPGAGVKLPPAASTEKGLDYAMFGVMRIILALSAWIIIWIDPTQPDRFVQPTYTALFLYAIYSIYLYLLARSGRGERHLRNAHWVDIAWYSILIGLSSGTNSIFFFGYLFAALAASFTWGLPTGLATVGVSAVAFLFIGYLTAPSGPQFKLNLFLIQPTYMLVLGAMMAYRGGVDIRLRRRNDLLREITAMAGPRNEVDHVLAAVLRQLRVFYNADSCLLVLKEFETGKELMRRVTRNDHGLEGVPELLAAQAAENLLCLPDDAQVVYRRRGSLFPLRSPVEIYDVNSGERLMHLESDAERLASLMEAEAYITVPARYRGVGGRLMVAGNQWTFQNSDCEFLAQVLDHLFPLIDNIRLIDRIANSAAEDERRRIARDIHDSIVQPYIGLKLGLTAARTEAARSANTQGGAATLEDLDRLIELTDLGIEDLRGYIRDLRSPAPGSPRTMKDGLVPAISRFAHKFSTVTGIRVEVASRLHQVLDERLEAELFQMTVEGLSNIRRHSKSESAFIEIGSSDENVWLKLVNEDTNSLPIAIFQPNSIAERAAALGGSVSVAPSAAGGATVRVDIPLGPRDAGR